VISSKHASVVATTAQEILIADSAAGSWEHVVPVVTGTSIMTLVARDEELWAACMEPSGGLRWFALRGAPALTLESFGMPPDVPDEEEDIDDEEDAEVVADDEEDAEVVADDEEEDGDDDGSDQS
jgi:hypothetical protein